MSRGGFRGGRGGGRGGMPPGVGFGYGQISQTEWKEGISRIKAQSQNRGVLYPPLDSNSTSYLTAPTEHESMILSHEIALENTLSSGKLPQNDPGAQIVQPGQVPPWRIASERKVVGIEIESYSDRFNAPAPKGSSKLDPLALRMDQAMFPPALWSAYFDGQANEGKRPKKRRKVDDLDGDDDKVEEESQITEEEDFDFDDDESDHQDYDANYFDNGEGDDDDEGDDEGGDAYED